mmetsp:Transcript_22431/g.60177  ORF Transcript_22431/g.60177 Transcript_22431/m.60177 type:complete len:208 (-) Transcript_22431:55-678(-)
MWQTSSMVCASIARAVAVGLCRGLHLALIHQARVSRRNPEHAAHPVPRRRVMRTARGLVLPSLFDFRLRVLPGRLGAVGAPLGGLDDRADRRRAAPPSRREDPHLQVAGLADQHRRQLTRLADQLAVDVDDDVTALENSKRERSCIHCINGNSPREHRLLQQQPQPDACRLFQLYSDLHRGCAGAERRPAVRRDCRPCEVATTLSAN